MLMWSCETAWRPTALTIQGDCLPSPIRVEPIDGQADLIEIEAKVSS